MTLNGLRLDTSQEIVDSFATYFSESDIPQNETSYALKIQVS